jgi:DNA polymerase III alpha subunit (gram-positive type)
MENRFESLLKIDSPLSPKVIELTKITDELLATRGADYNTTIREFHSYITKTTQPYTRTFMVAHNCDGFDKMFLKTALKKLGLSLPANIFFLDSLPGILCRNAPVLPKHTLPRSIVSIIQIRIEQWETCAFFAAFGRN